MKWEKWQTRRNLISSLRVLRGGMARLKIIFDFISDKYLLYERYLKF